MGKGARGRPKEGGSASPLQWRQRYPQTPPPRIVQQTPRKLTTQRPKGQRPAGCALEVG